MVVTVSDLEALAERVAQLEANDLQLARLLSDMDGQMDRLVDLVSKFIDVVNTLMPLKSDVPALQSEVKGLRQELAAVSKGINQMHNLVYFSLTPDQQRAFDEDPDNETDERRA